MRKAVFQGFVASGALVSLYLLVMGLTSGSWSYTVTQLIGLRYWIGTLVLGFGVQVGLFSYLKNCHKTSKLEEGASATGIGTSSVAMLACCAHHLTDILPFLGLSAATLVLARYQTWFLSLGIVSNMIGIFLMIRQIRKMRM